MWLTVTIKSVTFDKTSQGLSGTRIILGLILQNKIVSDNLESEKVLKAE